MIHKHVELSVSVERQSIDALTQSITIAHATMFPKSDWFSLSLSGKETAHIKLSEWERIKSEIDELIAISNKADQ